MPPAGLRLAGTPAGRPWWSHWFGRHLPGVPGRHRRLSAYRWVDQQAWQESVKTMCARPADIEILADWWTVTRIGPTSSGVLVGTADLQIPLHVLQNGDTPGLGWRNTKSEEDPLKRRTGLLAARNTAHRGGEARVNRRFEAFREVRRLL